MARLTKPALAALAPSTTTMLRPWSSERCVRRRPVRRTGRSPRWLRKLAFPTPRSAECGRRSACPAP